MKTTTAIFVSIGALLVVFIVLANVMRPHRTTTAESPAVHAIADSTATDSGVGDAGGAFDSSMVLGMIGAVAVIFLYFLPTWISSKRKHPNGQPIFLINFALGWTLIGWFVALVWAVSAINPALIPGGAPRPRVARFCPTCGAAAPTGAFCVSCGAKIVA